MHTRQVVTKMLSGSLGDRDSDTACSQVDCMELKQTVRKVAHLLWNDRRERTLCQLAMTNLSPARHAHSPSLANRTGWEMVLQKESVLCLLCHLIPLLRIHLRACTIYMQVVNSGLLSAMPGMQRTTLWLQKYCRKDLSFVHSVTSSRCCASALESDASER